MPTISIISPANETLTSNPNVSINYLVVDYDNETVSCTLFFDGVNESFDNAVLNNTTSNFNMDNVSDGLHTYWINCSDGIFSNESLSQAITIDTTPPGVWFKNTTDESGTYAKDWIFIGAVAEDWQSPIDNFWWDVNITLFNPPNGTGNGSISQPPSCGGGGPTPPWTMPCNQNKTNLSDGIYVFTAYANDTAGNLNWTETRTVILDGRSRIISTDPANESIGIARDKTISITFNEVVNNSFINESTFYINKTADGKHIPATLSTSNNITFNLKPIENEMSYLTEYTVTLRAGVQDLAGNEIVSDYVFSFTTGNRPVSRGSSGGGGGGGGSSTTWVATIELAEEEETQEEIPEEPEAEIPIEPEVSGEIPEEPEEAPTGYITLVPGAGISLGLVMVAGLVGYYLYFIKRNKAK